MDANETILFTGESTSTLSSALSSNTVEIALTEIRLDCILTPGNPDFGEVPLGSSVTDTLWVANGNSATGNLTGEIGLLPVESPHFRILAGTGPFALGPGIEMAVVLEFSPLAPGLLSCQITTGTDCGAVGYTGTGVTSVGSITINPDPDLLAAPWRLTGPDVVLTGNGDLVYPDMAPGVYTITWNSVADWTAPAEESLTLLENDNIRFDGLYTRQTGTVEIVPHPLGLLAPWELEDPAGAVEQGVGHWTMPDRVVGRYIVTWGPVDQYDAPAPEARVLAADSTLSFHGDYALATGTLVIDPSPDHLQAPWSLYIPDLPQPLYAGSGDTTLTEMEPNNYTLVWEPVEGWDSPPQETHYLSGRETFTFAGFYAQCLGVVGWTSPPSNAWCVAWIGEYVFVADGNSGLQIVKIKDPTAPYVVGTFPTPGFARGVALDSGRRIAFVADGTGGLQVVNVAVPTAPSLIGTVDVPGSAFSVTVSGDYAYVTNSEIDLGLHIVDINPSSGSYLTIVGAVATPGRSWGVTVVGNYAYVADGFEGGLQIIDVGKPTAPFIIGAIATDDDASGVVVQGDYAFVANGATGLQVIDVGNPANPVWRASAPTGSRSFALDLAGDFLFVADRTDGIIVLDINKPDAPQIVGGARIAGEANWIGFDGARSYVAAGEGGLVIIGTACFSPSP